MGKLDSVPGATFIVRFFSNPADTFEGKTFIGQKGVTTSADGVRSFTFSPDKAIRPGKVITATATRSGGGTSEFCAPKKVVRL